MPAVPRRGSRPRAPYASRRDTQRAARAPPSDLRRLRRRPQVRAKIGRNPHHLQSPRWPERATRTGSKEVSSMIATWQIVAVVLLAVLVGALVPVLIQLRRTLQSAEHILNTTGPRLDRTLDEVSEAASRINHLGRSLEKDAEGLRVFTDAAAGLGRSLKQAQELLRVMTAVGAAVGPAIAAGLRALFAPARDDGVGPPARPDEARAPAETPSDGR